MIPRGIKFITGINLLLVCLYLLLGYRYGMALRNDYPMAAYAAAVTGGGIIVLQISLSLRLYPLLGFVRVLVYAMAILQGLQIMLVFKDLFSPAGALLIGTAVLLVVYLIGVRGYLASATALQYFGFTKTNS
jgi:hypothetical protein